MTSHASPGFLKRLLNALGGGLARGILGRSGHGYLKQFTGSDGYWDRAIAAQLGWPQQQLPQCDPAKLGTGSVNAGAPAPGWVAGPRGAQERIPGEAGRESPLIPETAPPVAQS
jgi:hypothetical protein